MHFIAILGSRTFLIVEDDAKTPSILSGNKNHIYICTLNKYILPLNKY